MRGLIQKYSIISFVGLAYFVTSAIWAALVYRFGSMPIDTIIEMPEGLFLALAAGSAPTTVAILLTAVSSGRAGLRELFSRVKKVRVNPMLWVIAFGIPFLFSTIATAIMSDQLGPTRFPAWYAIIPPFAFAVVLLGPLCEEIGWRGYLQPKLLERVSPARAAIFVGIIWTAWHFPLSFTPGATTPLDSFQAIVTYLVSSIGMSAIMLTIVVAGRGSIALSIAFHWAANVALFQVIRPIFPSATIAQWQQIDAITGWFYFGFGIACLVWLKSHRATQQIQIGKGRSI
jgi:uncharacterized protein